MAQINQAEEEIFSYTFKLRKAVKKLPEIVDILQLLEKAGYSCFMEFTGPNSRWLEIHLYEQYTQHSTLAFSRLLKEASPSPEEMLAISKVNFAAAHNAHFVFECNERNTQITVKLIAPSDDEAKKKAILDYVNLH